jgi:hypothetical protein
MWKLKDILAAAGEPPMITCSTKDENEYALLPLTAPVKPCPVGAIQTLEIDSHTGLPPWLSIDERRCLRLAVVNTLQNKTITWKAPVTVSTQMKLTLQDKQLPTDSARKLVKVVLRARPTYQGRPAFDNVKIGVEEERGRIRRYFAKCLAFFQDDNKEMFVGVRWYETPDRNEINLIDPIVKLAELKLSPVAITRSYGIMPIQSIVNGALIIRVNEQYWALQSPREQAEYLQNK